MLLDRIIGAFTFRKGVYAEVENDTTFTTTAWILVAAVSFLNQLGQRAVASSLVSWLLGTIIGTIMAVVAFGVGAFVISWVGRTVFDADVTFEELVRTLGLAYVWQIIGFVGVVALISETLACVLTPVIIIAIFAMLAAWLIAAKEALDLDWTQTIVTVVIGVVAYFVVMAIVGAILGLLGLGAAAVGSALSG